MQFIVNRFYLISQTTLTRNKVTIFGHFSDTLSHVLPFERWENSCKSVDIKYQE
jgi:hypothetical protein